MFSKVFSYAIVGLEACRINIEVDVSPGLPCTIVVGLPDNAVKESKERVRSAIKNSHFDFPAQRITVNLSPGDLKKEGPCFDLGMALGILACNGKIHASSLERYVILGELSLDGKIRPIKGAFLAASSLSKHPCEGIILPEENAPEAALATSKKIYPVRHLTETVHFLNDPSSLDAYKGIDRSCEKKKQFYDIDFCDVKGQSFAKRGLEIAAAGGHNILLIGPPGSGKTMLAKRLITILPDMADEEALETMKIHSAAGLISPSLAHLGIRPFRAPHHTSSDVALVGGGTIPKPGEASLAHHGVLFLDELPEFNRDVLESLRQPLEDGFVNIARAHRSIKFPSQFMLVGAMNPCPCGWYTDPKKECRCTPHKIQKYLSKISGPLLDRIDIHIEVPSLKSQELLTVKESEPSSEMKKRSCRCREIQQQRFAHKKIFCNAHMNDRQIKEFCTLDEESKTLLKVAIDELGLSARAHNKIIKVARTIADLDGQKNIRPEHLSEAIQYRSLDRSLWC